MIEIKEENLSTFNCHVFHVKHTHILKKLGYRKWNTQGLDKNWLEQEIESV